MTGYPRYNRPSASHIGRVDACPFSHKMEQRAPRIETKDSAHGDAVHEAIAGKRDPDTLDIGQRKTWEMCVDQEDRLYNEWIGGGVYELHTFREIRLGLTVLGRVLTVTEDSKAAWTFTGQEDMMHYDARSGRGLIVDHKSLPGDVPDAVDNAQLRSLAVLADGFFRDVQSIRVAIAQPLKGPPTVAEYDRTALDAAKVWLDDVIAREESSTEKDLNPGPHCTNCAARFFCPAFNQVTLQELEVVNPMNIAGMGGKTQRAAMYSRIQELPPERHFAAWRGIQMVKRYVEAMDSATKDRAECDPAFQEFVTLVEEEGDREITDAQEAFTRLHHLGVTMEDMIAASKVSVTKIQEAVRVRSGLKSTGKTGVKKYNLTDLAAKDAMAQALGPVLTRKAPSKTLVAVERSLEE